MNELSFQMKNTRDEEALARQDELPVPVIIDGDTDPEEVGQDHGAMQGLDDNDHPQYFHKATETSDAIPEGATKKFLTATQKEHLTGDGDGDAEHKHDSKMDAAIGDLDAKETPADADVLVLKSGDALKKVTVESLRGPAPEPTEPTTRWEPLTTGDLDNPELLFGEGDVIMVEVAI